MSIIHNIIFQMPHGMVIFTYIYGNLHVFTVYTHNISIYSIDLHLPTNVAIDINPYMGGSRYVGDTNH